MKRTKRFTLIEILIVITIIAILAACIYPALMAVQSSSRRTKTETILTGVTTAIKVYKGDYYTLPSVSGSVQEQIGSWSGNIDRMEPNATYLTFFDILTYKNHKDGTAGPSGDVKNANTKAKQYLDPPKEYFQVKENKHSVRDGWGRPIVVFLDHDQDGTVEVPGDYGGGTYGCDSVAISIGNQDVEKASDKDNAQLITVN